MEETFNQTARWFGFTDAAPTFDDLQPYQVIAPGVEISFEANTGAVCRSRFDDRGKRMILDVEAVGGSSWLTMEYAVDVPSLVKARTVLWAARMTSSPRAAYRLDLRLWLGNEGGFKDIAIGRGVLTSSERWLRETYFLDDAEDLTTCSAAKMILHLPLQAAAFGLSKVVYMPAC